MTVIRPSTTIRTRHRRRIARAHPPCHICGQPIDYTAPYLDPGEYVVDHVIPLNRGGTDTLDNKAAAHRKCNRDKSDRLESDDWHRSYVTARHW